MNATDAENMRLEARKDLMVLTNTNMKSIMIEMGFLNNYLECSNQGDRNYQNKIAI